MSWKTGDWCFFEWKLGQIKETKNNGVTEFSDGMFSTSGHGLHDRMFPLTMRNKIISDTFESYSSDIHAKGARNLNFPDIHRKLVDLWVEAMESKETKEEVELRKVYDKTRKFFDGIMSECQELKYKEVEGIPLFR